MESSHESESSPASRPPTLIWLRRRWSASAQRSRASSKTRSPGTEAGRAGEFGYVVGVDHVGQRTGLLRHGADVVVTDLAELLEAT